MGHWGEYVPVHVRKARAHKEMNKRRTKGENIQPIEIKGRKIATRFWGKKWCEHLEKFADFANRLPRGRTYVNNGSVCHLAIKEGIIEAFVSGSSLYRIQVSIKTLAKQKWETLKRKCSGHVGTMLELLQGVFSDQVMGIVADEKEGLFPAPKEMSFTCTCPDWADMCKHVAAVLYGIGHRLDNQPELLFVLRGVNASELISTEITIAESTSPQLLLEQGLAEIFGIELDQEVVKPSNPKPKSPNNKSKDPRQPKKPPKFSLDVDQLRGKDLFNFRMHKGLTVAQLAELLQVTTASIYRWEKNPNILNLQTKSLEALKTLIR